MLKKREANLQAHSQPKTLCFKINVARTEPLHLRTSISRRQYKVEVVFGHSKIMKLQYVLKNRHAISVSNKTHARQPSAPHFALDLPHTENQCRTPHDSPSANVVSRCPGLPTILIVMRGCRLIAELRRHRPPGGHTVRNIWHDVEWTPITDEGR